MELLDYKKVLQDFQYKPNWGIGIFEQDGEPWIRMVMLVEDSRRPWRRWELTPYPQDESWSNYHMDFNTFGRMPPIQTSAGYSPSREVSEVVGTYPIPPFIREDEFLRWLVYTIKEMEMHELDEWARYKGVLLNDPHAEVKV